MKKNKQLTLTVGITTCYGDESIIDTVKSVRDSKGVGKFKFIIVADRVPIKLEIKKQLKKYNVDLIENKIEGSQNKKQKQILKLTKTDLIILTQDDVLLDKDAIAKTVKEFQKQPKLTMVSIRNQPVKAATLFEDVLNVGTNMANRMAKKWNNGDNYLSVIGRYMAFRTDMIKKSFRFYENVATTDSYYYFENKRLAGVFKYLSEVAVYFRNPQNMTEHLRKSSRFQYSLEEMSKYFNDIESEYRIPSWVTIFSAIEEFLLKPLGFIGYMGVYFYTRLLRMKPKMVMDPVWEVDVSTKKVMSN